MLQIPRNTFSVQKDAYKKIRLFWDFYFFFSSIAKFCPKETHFKHLSRRLILNILVSSTNIYYHLIIKITISDFASVCPSFHPSVRLSVTLYDSNSCSCITRCDHLKLLGMCCVWKICILGHPQTCRGPWGKAELSNVHCIIGQGKA